MATRKYRDQTWLHPGLQLRPSQIHGKGLVATRPLRKGETVLIFGGTLFSKAEIDAGKASSRTLMQIDDDSWLGNRAGEPVGEDYFINHTCDPNLWMIDEVTLVARRNIAAGEEITMDYAMHFADPNWTMRNPCKCRAPICRQVISGKDWTLAQLQIRYKDHFSPFLNKRIASLARTDQRDIRAW